jgi:hypothetical protein
MPRNISKKKIQKSSRIMNTSLQFTNRSVMIFLIIYSIYFAIFFRRWFFFIFPLLRAKIYDYCVDFLISPSYNMYFR